MGRHRKNRVPWRSKVTRELVEILTAIRDVVHSWEQSENKTDATADKLLEEMEERLRQRLPNEYQVTRQAPEEVTCSLFSASMVHSADDAALAVGMTEKIHWLRFREPFLITIKRSEQGNLDAIERFHRTLLDYDKMHLAGGQLPKFKVNYDHDVFFSTAWGLGLENLDEEEMAELFDEFCPCGEREHDGHALRMQRDRMFQAVAAASRKTD